MGVLIGADFKGQGEATLDSDIYKIYKSRLNNTV